MSRNPIRVLVDARALSDDNRYRGIGVYLRYLLPELAKIPDLSVSALVAHNADAPPGVRPVRIARHAPGRFRRIEHSLLLPYDIRRERPDVFHSPALQPPSRCTVPWVQTLHHVIPPTVYHPEFARDRRFWLRWAARIRAASGMIAVSGRVASEAVGVLGLDPDRVMVALHGADPAFRPPAVRPEPDPPYILYVSEFDPRKGYKAAFEIISALAARGHPHRLKVAGRIAPWIEAELNSLVRSSGCPERIDLLGFVPHASLPSVYQSAAAVLMTNRDEGFGLPAIEAMACGTPLVGFANDALAEVVSSGGELVEDGDIESITDRLERILGDAELWRQLSELGLRRAADFSWRRSAEVHAEMFRLVAG